MENIGKDNTLWRGRVADPTGVFTIYAGQYQPESAIFLSEMNIPAYVAVVGKARKFEPEDGSVYTSVRPEEINNADEKLRDRWVLDTAERTLERIKYIEDALGSGKSGNDLKEYLLGKGINAVLADGAVRAVEHYKNLDKTIAELKTAVILAVKAVALDREYQPAGTHKVSAVAPQDATSPSTAAPVNVSNMYEPADETKTPPEKEGAVAEEKTAEPETEPKEIIAGLIDKLDTGKGISYSTIADAAQKAGIDPDTIESGIKELMDEGRCYEPKIGILRKV